MVSLFVLLSRVALLRLLILQEMATGAEEVDDLTSCTVCWTEYDAQHHAPKVLNCFHTICLQCAEFICKNLAVACPLCRRLSPCSDGPLHFPSNSYILQMVQSDKDQNTSHDTRDIQQLKSRLKSILLEGCHQRKEMKTRLETTAAALRSTLKEIEDLNQENETQLAKMHTALAEVKNNPSIAESERLRRSIFQWERELTSLRKLKTTQQKEMATRIQISLRDAYNQNIPTCQLFEKGFLPVDLPDSSPFKNEIHLLSHAIFSILRQEKVVVKPGAGGLCMTVEDPSVDSQQIAALRSELAELGAAQRAELAQLAAAVKSDLSASWQIGNNY